MEELQLRKTMGGYKREDVLAYVGELVKKYEGLLETERAETKAARAEADAAAAENAKLFEKITALEAERDSVSRAVIAAQREADVILADAKTKADGILREKEQEAMRVEGQMMSLKGEIRTLRLSAAAALRKYESALSEISDTCDEDEEEE